MFYKAQEAIFYARFCNGYIDIIIVSFLQKGMKTGNDLIAGFLVFLKGNMDIFT